jgi:hypothetical protein
MAMQSSDQKTLYGPDLGAESKVTPVNVGHTNVYLIETESGHKSHIERFH